MALATINGIELYYEVHGEGPALVFAHGAPPFAGDMGDERSKTRSGVFCSERHGALIDGISINELSIICEGALCTERRRPTG